LNIESVSLLNSGGASYLRLKAHGVYLDLERIEISYFEQGSSRHKIEIFFEGCGSSNALRAYDTTFQINSTTPFDIAVYAIWDTSYLCGFLQEHFVSDSLFMNYSELLATTSINNLLQEFGAVYPNPSKGMIAFDFEAETVSIYNIQYSYINKLDVISGNLDLSHLHSGIYFLQFTQNDKKRLYRIVKE
jgi:hypothetical protein